MVHDLATNDPERSIVAIENGHVTGRKVGDGPSHVVLEALQGTPDQLHDHLSYLTRTKDGRSSNQPPSISGITTAFPSASSASTMTSPSCWRWKTPSTQFTATEKDEKEPEPISRNVSDLLDELIEQSVKLVGKPVALMNKEDKVKAVQFLNETGAFLITKSGDKVCKFFGISKYTLCTATSTSPRSEPPSGPDIFIRRSSCNDPFAAAPFCFL